MTTRPDVNGSTTNPDFPYDSPSGTDLAPASLMMPQERGRRGRGQGRGRRGQQGLRVSALYTQNCASCHGENAQGVDGTASLVSRQLFDQEHDRRLFYAIKGGVPGADDHAFGEVTSDDLIWGYVVHIREQQFAGLRSQYGSPEPIEGVYSSERESFRLEDVVTEGLTLPWGLDWLPDGKMLVTNRGGGMFVYEDGNKIAEVEGLPPFVEQGQGGLMEIRAHPTNGWLYLSVADPIAEGRGAMTKVYRGQLEIAGGSARWTNQETIWESEQEYYNTRGQHFGCKIDFDGNGHVVFSVGERGTNMRVHEDGTPYGKIMRLNLDGSIPDDNPVPGSAVLTTGHRNPQGLIFDLEGNLWDTEHGPRGGDELNLIVGGSNYGWPITAFSINYSDAPLPGGVIPFNGPDENFAMPVFRWLPSCAASGLDVVSGPAFPEWNGDLLAGGLRGQNLDRIRVKDGVMVEREEILQGIGRVREIRVHKDGTVYIAFNQPDKIVRLVPANLR